MTDSKSSTKSIMPVEAQRLIREGNDKIEKMYSTPVFQYFQNIFIEALKDTCGEKAYQELLEFIELCCKSKLHGGLGKSYVLVLAEIGVRGAIPREYTKQLIKPKKGMRDNTQTEMVFPNIIHENTIELFLRCSEILYTDRTKRSAPRTTLELMYGPLVTMAAKEKEGEGNQDPKTIHRECSNSIPGESDNTYTPEQLETLRKQLEVSLSKSDESTNTK